MGNCATKKSLVTVDDSEGNEVFHRGITESSNLCTESNLNSSDGRPPGITCPKVDTVCDPMKHQSVCGNGSPFFEMSNSCQNGKCSTNSCADNEHRIAYCSSPSRNSLRVGETHLRFGCCGIEMEVGNIGSTYQLSEEASRSLRSGRCHHQEDNRSHICSQSPASHSSLWNRNLIAQMGCNHPELQQQSLSTRQFNNTMLSNCSFPKYSYSAGNSIAHGITRSNAESPLTVDYGTHKSDMTKRESVFICSENTGTIDRRMFNLANMENSTSINKQIMSISQRSSLCGLSNRYLIHQPQVFGNRTNGNRASLGSLVNSSHRDSPRRTSRITESSTEKTDTYHVAIFDYITKEADELGARKGDKIRILDVRYVNMSGNFTSIFMYWS